MWTDEKWWDIVGPACYKYVKQANTIDVKVENQVRAFFVVCLHVFVFLLLHNVY